MSKIKVNRNKNVLKSFFRTYLRQNWIYLRQTKTQRPILHI